MSDVRINRPALTTLEGGDAGLTSVRAKALVFSDPASQETLRYIERIAPSLAPIIILGETGTGKELIARHIHKVSGRQGPFVAVNCGAISEHLADSELFGHEAGSFTGATGRREGWFEAANGGSLFLDEIGDLPLPLQVKLLRVLQEREVVRVGSRHAVPVNVRLLAATNVDLGEAVSAGHFRLDLFYRLNICQVRLPPLRKRTGDIVPLAQHFLSVYSQRLNLPLPELGDSARRALERYGWPGNIRELENVIHFALMVASDHEIQVEHLKLNGGPIFSKHDVSEGPLAQGQSHAGSSMLPPEEAIRSALHQMFAVQSGRNIFNELEKMIIDEAFIHCRHSQVRTAALLGISRNILRTFLKKYGHLAERPRDAGDEDAERAMSLSGARAS